MLMRQLGSYLLYSSVLRRHLVQRRAAARDVEGTTPIPFLRRIGMIETPVGISLPRLASRGSFSFAAPEKDIVEPVLSSEILQEVISAELRAAVQPDLPQEALLQSANDSSTRVEEENIAKARARPALVPAQRIEKSKAAPPIQSTPNLAHTDSSPAKPARIPESKAFVPETDDVHLSDHPDRRHIRVADPEAAAAPASVPADAHADTTNEDVSAAAAHFENVSTLANIPVPGSTAEAAPKVPTRLTLLDRLAEITSGAKKTSAAPEIPLVVRSKSKKSEAALQDEVKTHLVPSQRLAAEAESILEMQGQNENLKATATAPAVPASKRRAQIEEVPKSEIASESTKGVAKSGPPAAKPSGTPWSWKNQADAAPEASEATELFAPRTDVDLSPAAWRDRLAEAIRVETELQKPAEPTKQNMPVAAASKFLPSRARPGAVRAASRRNERPTLGHAIAKPTRMSESARRFLTPLVGFDPGDVKVQQGPAVSRVLTAASADAVAEGESVLLGPGHDESSPKTLGLLAHELTHVVRGRNSTFVPPVVRPIARGEKEATFQTVSGADMRTHSILLTTDEETIARRVETAVKAAAEEMEITRDDSLQTPTTSPGRAPLERRAPRDASVNFEGADGDSDDKWGGLPAPWEPMPEWVRTTDGPDSAPKADIGTSPVATPSSEVSLPTPSSAAASCPARADVERSLFDEDSARTAGHEEAEHKDKKVGPDLDALAKQVYSIMRQRLAADRRRELMY